MDIINLFKKGNPLGTKNRQCYGIYLRRLGGRAWVPTETYDKKNILNIRFLTGLWSRQSQHKKMTIKWFYNTYLPQIAKHFLKLSTTVGRNFDIHLPQLNKTVLKISTMSGF